MPLLTANSASKSPLDEGISPLPLDCRPNAFGTASVNRAFLVPSSPLFGAYNQGTPGSRGAMLRAYDKATGKELGAVWMPAPQSGSPMTYSVGGQQYLVVAISGGSYSGEYIAFRLASTE